MTSCDNCPKSTFTETCYVCGITLCHDCNCSNITLDKLDKKKDRQVVKRKHKNYCSQVGLVRKYTCSDKRCRKMSNTDELYRQTSLSYYKIIRSEYK